MLDENGGRKNSREGELLEQVEEGVVKADLRVVTRAARWSAAPFWLKMVHLGGSLWKSARTGATRSRPAQKR